MQELYCLSRVYGTDRFCMKSKKGVEKKMRKMRGKASGSELLCCSQN